MWTELQRRPWAPVCFVTSLWPIIWSANILASVRAIVECALSSSTSKDLCLDNHIISADLLRDGFGFGSSCCNGALGNTDTILSQEIRRKVLVYAQSSLLLCNTS